MSWCGITVLHSLSLVLIESPDTVGKTHVVNCSFNYWIPSSFQVIIRSSVAIYQATCLYKWITMIKSSLKEASEEWTLSKLLVYFSGILAGTDGGMLGIGGGTILTPLYLELGFSPQIASATSAFSMFSSSVCCSVLHPKAVPCSIRYD